MLSAKNLMLASVTGSHRRNRKPRWIDAGNGLSLRIRTRRRLQAEWCR
jgi:hypothetical protein